MNEEKKKQQTKDWKSTFCCCSQLYTLKVYNSKEWEKPSRGEKERTIPTFQNRNYKADVGNSC